MESDSRSHGVAWRYCRTHWLGIDDAVNHK